MTLAPAATILGYPRIGSARELKKATEAYWAGTIGSAELAATGRRLRAEVWTTLRAAGLDGIPSNTFSLYDQMLDTAVMFDAIPDRFAGLTGLDAYFAMARGADGIPAVEMTKWFTTNYHYLVPELGPETRFRLAGGAEAKPVTEYLEARALGIETRPVIIGPLTFLLLSKGPHALDHHNEQLSGQHGEQHDGPHDDQQDGRHDEQVNGDSPGLAAGQADRVFRSLLDGLVEAYAELLERLAGAGAAWVQIDEPVLATDRTPEELAALRRVYDRLCGLPSRPRILLATYFGEIGEALPVLAETGVEAIALDFVSGPGNLEAIAAVGGLPRKTLVAGVVDGRNVWRTDTSRALATCATLLGLVDQVTVSTSCSLLHVPLDLSAETRLDGTLRSRLAFARQKVDEVVVLGRAVRHGELLDAHTRTAPAPTPASAQAPAAAQAPTPASGSAQAPTAAQAPAPLAASVAAGALANREVRQRLAALDGHRRGDRDDRFAAQREAWRLPPLATTTIGSFPQTDEVRKARADLRAGRLDADGYRARMRAEIASVIALQQELGLDVLVHGEPERNDMVQYFAEQLDGYAATDHGWVQSYGTRYVRPPILHGDISRPRPMTVEWAAYAQSLTTRPVKGMLTGPVTMLAWSFVRDDQPLAETARQVALALRDEIADLEAAGIGIIQVDEPALRELLPLRRAEQRDYLDWAVEAFRLATSGAADTTQIHTHMCYSEFGEIITAIDALDADVTSVEAARSRMELVTDLARAGYGNGIGPGVYDIHSPRVPSVEEMQDNLSRALTAVVPERLWVNPDCGLKTRAYPETMAALRNMVAAAHRLRATLT